ncbi:MAG: heme NO-binding domain-containing protein, partial [Pseudomonadota bacterium]
MSAFRMFTDCLGSSVTSKLWLNSEEHCSMKGLVFREFFDFVEDALGAAVVEDMIEMADVPSGAAYTVVGKYDWREMAALVSALS